jgi:hypothetical protein
MGFDMGAVDGDFVRDIPGGRQAREEPVPDALGAPTIVAVKMVVGGPYSGGQSLQRQPERSTCRTPLMTRRSSTRGAPGRPFGRCGSITAQASSLNHSNLLMPPSCEAQSESEHHIKLNQMIELST